MLELFFNDFINLVQENPLGQFFGYLGMFIILFGFFQTDDKKAKIIIAISMIAWILHFFFMGLMTALFASIIGIIRMILSLKYQKNKYVFFGISFAAITLGIITYESPLHLIPIFTSVLGAFAFIFLEKIPFRVATLLASLAWLYFHIQVGSLGGMTNEVLTQFILLVTIVRMLSHDGHIHQYRDKIHDILHRHEHVDIGTMVIVKDSQKIIKTEGYIHKFFRLLKEKILKRISRSAKI